HLGAVPGMADHGFPLKTVADAMTLRFQVMRQLEKAEVTADQAKQAQCISFVIVGGGFSGIETAGEINDLVRSTVRFYPSIDASKIQVTVIHSGEQILPELSMGLRIFARKKMEARGIRFILRARAAAVTPEGVRLLDGAMVRGATVVSTIGTAPAEI